MWLQHLGKESLLLDVTCSHLRDIEIFAICISYNSDTPHSEADSSHTMAPRFWARVIHSVARTCGIHLDWADFEKLSFISLLTINRVMDFIQTVCSPKFRRGRFLIADEFSRVIEGLRLNTQISCRKPVPKNPLQYYKSIIFIYIVSSDCFWL